MVPMSGIGAHTAAVGAIALLLAAPAAAGERSAPWAFAGIGPSQRTLRITVGFGGCDRPTVPLVHEAAGSVRITARVTTPDDTGVACLAVYGYGPQLVRLARPLAGRRLLGATPTAAARPAGIPHVVGLAPGDAVTVLRRAGASPHITRRRGVAGLRRVLAQRGARIVVGGR